MLSSLLLIRTGGTIDAEPYDDPKHPPHKITALKGAHSTVAALARRRNIALHPWSHAQEERFVKDSASYDDGDIAALAKVINAQPERHILITHGTNLIAPNAAKIKALLGATDKTIFFIGAMVPLSMAERFGSDAEANIDYALEHIAQLQAGVYVVGIHHLTGQRGCFAPETTEKDHARSLETSTLIMKEIA